MKILVTGANGFIGRLCVTSMLACGHEVDALDLVDFGYFNGVGIHYFYSLDITTSFTLADGFDAVIHLAAHNVTHTGDSRISMYMRVNVDGTANVLLGVNARRFVFLSTAKVYRKQGGIITEENEIDPQRPYEESKRLAEELCLRAQDNSELVILRSVNVFGPGQPEKAVIPVFFAKAIRGESIEVFGPSGAWLQFVYVNDLIRALKMAAITSGINGIYNVASDEVVRLEDLALMVKKICKSSSPIYFTDERFEPKGKVCCAKINEKLGWRPSITLEKGLYRYYEYCIQQRQT